MGISGNVTYKVTEPIVCTVSLTNATDSTILTTQDNHGNRPINFIIVRQSDQKIINYGGPKYKINPVYTVLSPGLTKKYVITLCSPGDPNSFYPKLKYPGEYHIQAIYTDIDRSQILALSPEMTITIV
jgi:hypothetical protein